MNIADAVTTALAMKKNAAAILGARLLGAPIVYLEPGEIVPKLASAAELRGQDRIWEISAGERA